MSWSPSAASLSLSSATRGSVALEVYCVGVMLNLGLFLGVWPTVSFVRGDFAFLSALEDDFFFRL